MAKAHLGQGKEGVPFTRIPVLQAGNDQTRSELAVYCMKVRIFDSDSPVVWQMHIVMWCSTGCILDTAPV